MFGLIISGRPCQVLDRPVAGAEGEAPLSYAFNFLSTPRFSHIVVFLLPGHTLPPDFVGSVWMQYVNPNKNNNGGGVGAEGSQPKDFRFLGAVANEKPSAIFKVDHIPFRLRRQQQQQLSQGSGASTQEVEMSDIAEQPARPMIGSTGSDEEEEVGAMITIGIAVEPAGLVAPRLAALTTPSTSLTDMLGRVGEGNSPPQRNQQVIQLQLKVQQLKHELQQMQPTTVSTKVLAQRIIGNAFNFLASFAATDPNNVGQEVVPLKSFRDWWAKFERRVEADPGFLERGEFQE